MQTAFSASTEEILVRLLVQFAVILVVARTGSAVARRLGQSQSIGEILAGVLLGPSLFGWVAPGAFGMLFPADAPNLIPYFSHIGLVLALFLIGMEFDFRTVAPHFRSVVGVAFGTLVVPLLAGFAIAPWLWSLAPGENGYVPYALFVGMVLAITAIPIMGRVLIEQGLSTTRAGVVSITTGAAKDLFTWFLLALVTGIARPPLDPWKLGRMVGLSILLGVLTLTLGRRAIAELQRRAGWVDGRPSPVLLTGLLVMLFLLAAATSEIGIFAIFGAFLAGVAVSSDRRLAHAVSDRLHDLTVYLFLPIFFTFTGLRADLSQLSGVLWLAMLAATVVGSLSCGGVATVIARWSGKSWPESAAIGVLMNTPGLMVLILLNMGLDLGVVPKALFSILVGNAMLRNLAVTPVLRWAKARGLPEATAPVDDAMVA